MSKDSTAVSAKQSPENPVVLIKYEPENALGLLATNATKTLASLRKVTITNPATLASASEVLSEAEIRADQIEMFKATLREKVQDAAAKFRAIPGYDDFEVTLTIRKWKLNSMLMDAIQNLRNVRASYLAEEDRKLKQKQADADAEQRRINQKAADDAGKAAKASGADKQTIAQIKENVMMTPAPIVESKAQTVAESIGASLRYGYTAKIMDLRKFLTYCLANDAMYATLGQAIPEIEKTFRKMAADQKESFVYPGITFVKTPIDVSRR